MPELPTLFSPPRPPCRSTTRPEHRRRPWWHLAWCLGWLVVPFSASGQTANDPPPSQPQDPSSILVLAAASLADVLPLVARDWEAQGGTPVRFSFAGTSRLAPQVIQGAPADIFVSADRDWMDWVEERGGIREGTRRHLAGNSLVLAVPADVALPPGDLDELVAGNPDRIALADGNVPAGRYARQALESAGVFSTLESRIVSAGSVRGTLEWVARGEVDAGIVYATDAKAEPRVQAAFVFPTGSHDRIDYSGAVTAGSAHPGDAAAFLAYASGPGGRALFDAAGFRAPGPQEPVEVSLPFISVPDPVSAIRLSVVVALLATLVGLIPAIALGWVLARKEFVGKSLFATLILSPLVLPPVVTGFLLLSLLGSQGPVGSWLAAVGLRVPFTLLGAALAALVVGLPLYVMAIRGAFQSVDTRYEELSWTLGVHKAATFRRVTLPLALPGILAGAVLAFARALGEFGATIVLAGNVEGSTQTIALAVYSMLESPAGHQAVWLLVGASIAISLAALLGFETLTRRQRARLEDHRV